LEESSFAQRQRAIAKAEALRETLVDIVAARYPLLTKLAQEYAIHQSDIGKLRATIQSLAAAPDEAHVRFILSASPAA
jgi:hypothetical protein